MLRHAQEPLLAAWLPQEHPHPHHEPPHRPQPRPLPRPPHQPPRITDEALNDHHGLEGDQDAARKVYALRSSLSHLTTHLDALTTRLAASESSLASLQLTHAAALAQHAERSSAMQALCLVWEGRWREERRLRDDVQGALEAQVGVAAGGARTLNGARRRRETTLTVLEVSSPSRPTRSRRLSHSSTSTSSPPRDGSTRRITLNGVPAPSRPQRRNKSRALVAQLTHELQHSRAEVERVARLTADLHVRQTELARLYASLDALMPLHALALAPTSTSPAFPAPPTSSTAAAFSSTPARARPPSVLDLPDARALAAGSRAHTFLGRRAALGEGSRALEERGQGDVPRDVEVTLGLEDEVRQLEEEIARLDGPREDEAHAASSVLPVDGSQLGDVSEDPRSAPLPAIDTAQHQAEVAHLEAELDSVRNALRQAEMERGTLERLVREKDVELGERAEREAQLEGRVGHLERERSRLLSLLTASESESTALQSQLASTHASLDALAARVHGRIVELQGRLAVAERERRKLEGEVDWWRGRAGEGEGQGRRSRGRDGERGALEHGEGVAGWSASAPLERTSSVE